MRIQTKEWSTFLPGVRNYQGKKTLFYNGEILFEGVWVVRILAANGRSLIYDWEERQTWEVIIVLPGVEIIPELTFYACLNVETIIMADDSVKTIGKGALDMCVNVSFVKLSRNLLYIGPLAFLYCRSLTSVFIPNSCRRINEKAFLDCNELTIFNVPQHTEVPEDALSKTALEAKAQDGNFTIEWVKSINEDNEYSLHRLCSSMDPSEARIYQVICEQGGLSAMARKNTIGITPSEYLAANPYADVDEMKLMKRFVLENMGEIV